MAEQTRPKGRARGRARVAASSAEGAQQMGPRGVKSVPPHASAEVGEGIPGSGRGVKRGAMRAGGAGGSGDPTHGEWTPSQPAVLLGGRKNYNPAIHDPATKPAHIQDKRGKAGKEIQLLTNFYKLNASRTWCLCQYSVEYDPQIEHMGARKGMLKDHPDLLGNAYIFDGALLFTLKKLPEKVTVVHSQRRTDETTVKITLTLVNELPPNSPICLQLHNLIFRGVLEKLGMQQVGRHYYDYKAAFSVQCRQVTLELWPGFITSILRYENNVMLCAELSHKLMRKDTVLDVMNGIYQECRRRNRNFKEECGKFLIGQIVLTRYNNNTYRVDGIVWDTNVQMKFKKKDQSISYAEYYQEQYNITIQDQQQPLLLSRPKKRDQLRGLEAIHLVPELCTVTGLTDELRADFQTMKALAEHTKQGPTKRVQALTNFMQRISNDKNVQEHLNRWGLRFDQKLMNMKGRVLEPEKILFGKDRIVNAGVEASWDRSFRDQFLLRCVDLKDWYLVHVGNDEGTANNLVQTMCQVAQAMGFNMSRPSMVRATSDRPEVFQAMIREVLAKNKKTQLICCLLPSSRKDRYDAIKHLCCVDQPVPTQVVLSRTLSKPQRVKSIATKIAIQINCKLGGEAWAVHIPMPGCMMIGVDTYHDSAQKGQSVGGFLASLNRYCTRWYCNTTFQQSGTELIDGLKRCMSGALKKFYEVNGELPKRIFVYRDGVGDGQLEMVKDYEIPQIMQCFQISGQPDYKPKLTYIVVKKRINARFFQQTQRGPRTELSNPPPGSIVDDVVTRPDWYDFFIVSQSVREGTVSPSHYNVIYDESGLKPEQIQVLTYKLCHIYYNWPEFVGNNGSVRVLLGNAVAMLIIVLCVDPPPDSA